MSSPEQPYYNQLVLIVDGGCKMTMDDEPGRVVMKIVNDDGLIVQEIVLVCDEWTATKH